MKNAGRLNISLRQLRLNNILKHFYNIKGVKKSDEGKFKEALKLFTKAIGLEPKDSKSYFNRATVKIDSGDIQGARADFALSESCVNNGIRLEKLEEN
jgi:tetratricopeptide (TPR) repeat protein